MDQLETLLLERELEIPTEAEAAFWSTVITLMQEIQRDGASVLCKLDGQRTHHKHTLMVKGGDLQEKYVRRDSSDLHFGLSEVIVEYAEQVWKQSVTRTQLGSLLPVRKLMAPSEQDTDFWPIVIALMLEIQRDEATVIMMLNGSPCTHRYDLSISGGMLKDESLRRASNDLQGSMSEILCAYAERCW